MQRLRALELQVALLDKYDLFDRDVFIHADDRKVNVACGHLTIRPDKWRSLLFGDDVDVLKRCRRDPGEFTAGIDKRLANTRAMFTLDGILDLATNESRCTDIRCARRDEVHPGCYGFNAFRKARTTSALARCATAAVGARTSKP